ncbi:tyrosine-type recombinase/integrase [Raineya sp.]|jgi:integrase
MKLSIEGNENNQLGYPYKLPRLVEGRKPYLVFYVWNENTNKLHRFRKEVPKGVDKKSWVKEKIKSITEILVAGYRIIKTKEEKTLEITINQDIGALQAINEIYEIRKRENAENSATREKSYIKKLTEFLGEHNLQDIKLKDIQTTHIVKFLDWVKAKGNSNITRNNYLTWLKAIFNIMVIRNYIDESPIKNIKKLREEQTKSIALSPEHLKIIMSEIKQIDTETYLFCLFVFYTFIRPIELRRLKVGQVNLQSQKIVIYGNQSKNKKTEYVMLPDPLKKELQETKFLERNTEEMLFSDKTPIQYSRNKYSILFSEIVRKNNLPKDYSLYCLKHTGVVEYYKKGCGIKFIKEQCRHSSLEQTDKYLKSLGLFENEEILKNAPEI